MPGWINFICLGQNIESGVSSVTRLAARLPTPLISKMPMLSGGSSVLQAVPGWGWGTQGSGRAAVV